VGQPDAPTQRPDSWCSQACLCGAVSKLQLEELTTLICGSRWTLTGKAVVEAACFDEDGLWQTKVCTTDNEHADLLSTPAHMHALV
jgi:hypothetical protein